MSGILDEHRLYLDDRARVDALTRGVQAAVRPGDVVVDLGSGTGILGLLACRAGAARVYAIEAGEVAELADAIAKANGFGDRMVIVRGHSLYVNLPERADVAVSDQIGRFGFDAGVLEYFEDARRRLLKPDGRLLPSRIDLWVAPVDQPAFQQHVSFWNAKTAGFDMSPVLPIAQNSGYPRRIDARDLLTAGVHAASIETGTPHSCIGFTVESVIEREGTMHAIAGWFSTRMDDRTQLTNAPGAENRINRRNAVFPLGRAVAVKPGQTVRISMAIRPLELHVKWVVELGSERFEHSTFAGMLISPDVMRRTRPGFRPRLTQRGLARKLVLDLADGRATVSDIERAVLSEFPALFSNPADAGRFVAEVVTRYAE